MLRTNKKNNFIYLRVCNTYFMSFYCFTHLCNIDNSTNKS